MSEFIANLVKDPKNPPEVVEITGFLGAAAEPGRTRIYLDTTLQNYVEVMEDKILHVEPVEGGQLGLSHIFIAADAQVFPREQPPRLDARTVFRGAVYQDYLNVPPGPRADIGVVPARYLTITPSCYPYCLPPTQQFYTCYPCVSVYSCPTMRYHCPSYNCPIMTTREILCFHVAMAQPMAPGAGMAAGRQQRAGFPPPPTAPVWRCPPVSHAYHCASQIWRCGPPPNFGPCPGSGFVPPEWGGGVTDPYAAFGAGYEPYAPYQMGY